MINKNEVSSLINMESSVGLHCQFFDSNKSFLKFRDESLSDGIKYNMIPFDEPGVPRNFFGGEDTINFADISIKMPPISDYIFPPSQEQSISSTPHKRLNQAERENLMKRGLKNLASLLLQTLLQKRYSSHREVAEQIEKHLILNDNEGQLVSRQQKNIKRRIYDALNVMISARVLQKELHRIQPRTHQSSARNFTVVNKCEEYYQKFNQLKTNVEAKRQLLSKMQSKRNALLLWMQKKQRQKEVEVKKQKFRFPVVIVLFDKGKKVRLEVTNSAMMMSYMSGEVYSQTDLIEQIVKEEYLRFHTINFKKTQNNFEMTVV